MKTMNFKNKKCFITGAASGIGRAAAIAMAELGAQMFLTDINKKQLEEVVSLIRENGGKVVSSEALDISDL